MTMAPMLAKTPMVTLLASQRTHLSFELNMHVGPQLSQMHFEHNLPVVPSVQSLHIAGDVPFSPYW